MAKIYTAQDMRERAKGCEFNGDLITTAMLRQAANAMEREERREKKHEYKVLFRRCDGRVDESIGHTEDIKTAREILRIYAGYKDAHIVRREVGEWEEVPE